jgi:hypothetical protein
LSAWKRIRSALLSLLTTDRVQVYYCGSGEQDVLCINERQVIIRSKAMYEPPSVASEGIYSDLNNRSLLPPLLRLSPLCLSLSLSIGRRLLW